MARLHFPGAIVHLISRFLNQEYLVSDGECRTEYLERLATAVVRTDWTLLAYAVMSNHIHLVLVAGTAPPWLLYQGLHASYGQWLNRLYGRLGPAFMGRPTTIYLPPERTATLVAYVHNNPVRAGVAPSADESDWSSHRAWLGLASASPVLNVRRGLELAGFCGSVEGRNAFHDLVVARSVDSRDPELSGTSHGGRRKQIRSNLALPVELAAPILTANAGECENALIYGASAPPVAARWDGDLATLVRCVAARSRVSVAELLSRSHLPAIVRARRTVVVAGIIFLRRRTHELSAAMAISESSVSGHLARAGQVLGEAAEVAAVVRGSSALQIFT